MRIDRQIELWGDRDAEVPPIRLKEGMLSPTADPSLRIPLESIQKLEVWTRDMSVVIGSVVVFGGLGAVCYGVGGLLHPMLGLVAGGGLAALGLLVAGFALVTAPHVKVKAGDGEWKWPVDKDVNTKELDFFVERLKAQGRERPSKVAYGMMGFPGILPQKLHESIIEVGFIRSEEDYIFDLDAEARETFAKCSVVLGFEVDVHDLEALSKWSDRYGASIVAGVARDDADADEAPEQASAAPTEDTRKEAVVAFLTKVNRPEDSIQRRLNTRADLANGGHHLPPAHLPSISEAELTLRTPEEVADRAHVLFLITMAANEVLETGEIKALSGPLAYVDHLLTPEEKAFVEAPTKEAAMPLTHRFESLVVLGWALGWLETRPEQEGQWEMQSPTDRELIERVRAHKAGETLLPVSDIADFLDRVYCCHWVCRDQMLKGGMPVGLNPFTVAEQHQCLLWLTEDTPWDEIQAHT